MKISKIIIVNIYGTSQCATHCPKNLTYIKQFLILETILGGQ